jgi:hypothetical protein
MALPTPAGAVTPMGNGPELALLAVGIVYAITNECVSGAEKMSMDFIHSC